MKFYIKNLKILKTWTRHGPIRTSNDPLGGAKTLLSAMVGTANIKILIFFYKS